MIIRIVTTLLLCSVSHETISSKILSVAVRIPLIRYIYLQTGLIFQYILWSTKFSL